MTNQKLVLVIQFCYISLSSNQNYFFNQVAVIKLFEFFHTNKKPKGRKGRLIY